MLLAFLEFEKKLYEFCDKNVGDKVLSTYFSYLWPVPKQESPEEYLISPKELQRGISKLLNILVKKGVIKEIDKPEELESVYPLYEILPHTRLSNGES
jgi:hypothetical protein